MLASSLSQAWPPFVLVAGLLVIGAVAHRDGVFHRLGGWLERTPGPPGVLFGAGCLLLAVTTALLNLDTAVVFVTPVIVVAARRRGIGHDPFLYAALFLVNASSLYLPGSNLTNLLVLAKQPAQGSFAAGMIAPALVATAVTAVGLAVVFRGVLGGAAGGRTVPGPGESGESGDDGSAGEDGSVGGSLAGPGAVGAIVAAVLMVTFRNPALPVAADALAVGTVASVWALPAAPSGGRYGERADPRDLIRAASPHVLAAIFAVAVGLGVLARAWSGPEQLLAHSDRWATAGIAAASTVLINNLPAAVMLSAHAAPHPRALLIGLNLGPNLAVTGSLAAFLWMRTAAQLGVATSVRRVTRIGVVLAPAAIAAALLVSSG